MKDPTWTRDQVTKREQQRTITRMEFIPPADRDETQSEWRSVQATVTDTWFTADGVTVQQCDSCGLFHVIGGNCPICR